MATLMVAYAGGRVLVREMGLSDGTGGELGVGSMTYGYRYATWRYDHGAKHREIVLTDEIAAGSDATVDDVLHASDVLAIVVNGQQIWPWPGSDVPIPGM